MVDWSKKPLGKSTLYMFYELAHYSVIGEAALITFEWFHRKFKRHLSVDTALRAWERLKQYLDAFGLPFDVCTEDGTLVRAWVEDRRERRKAKLASKGKAGFEGRYAIRLHPEVYSIVEKKLNRVEKFNPEEVGHESGKTPHRAREDRGDRPREGRLAKRDGHVSVRSLDARKGSRRAPVLRRTGS